MKSRNGLNTNLLQIAALIAVFLYASGVNICLIQSASAASIVGWGANSVGQATPPAGNNFTAISAGWYHSLALKSDGSIVGWGYNNYGQPAGNDLIAIATERYTKGESHSLALKSDGSIVGWGDNYSGQATPPAGNNYVAISVGSSYSLALKSDGSIVGWGYNGYGQATPPAGNNFVAVAAGGNHSLALKSDGSIGGWGYNVDGQATPPAGNNFVAIAAGGGYSLALKSDGSIVGWGYNYYGQATPPAGNNYVAISAGVYHGLALKSDGTIVGWGNNSAGQATPPAGNNFIAIAAGGDHSLALVGGLPPPADPPEPNLSIPRYSPMFISANKGTTVSAMVTVENLSTVATDTFHLSVSRQAFSGDSRTGVDLWDINLSPSVVTLAPGESEDILVEIPFQDDKSNFITIRATSTAWPYHSSEATLKAWDGTPASLFGVQLTFKRDGHTLEFDGPSCARISINESGQVIQVVFDPRQPGDLENAYLTVRDIVDSTIVKQVTLPVKFDKRSDQVIATAFDMTTESYAFSNSDIETNYRCKTESEGYCYGMAETSILYFTSELTTPDGKPVFELSQPESIPEIAAYQWRWQNKPASNPDDASEYALMETSISDGRPVILTLRAGKGISATNHAIVAYKITKDNATNISYISVYDNNRKYAQDMLIFAFPIVVYDATQQRFLPYYDGSKEYTQLDVRAADLVSAKGRAWTWVKGGWQECVLDRDWGGLGQRVRAKVVKIFRCPVTIQITDQFGRSIDSKGLNEIPDANFCLFGEEKLFALPPDLNYSTLIEGYDSGVFSFAAITPIESGSPTVAVFEDVPIGPEAEATFGFHSGIPDDYLALDLDGDGVVDQNIPADISVIHQTTVAYDGDVKGYRSEWVSFRASLTTNNGQPLQNKTLFFGLGSQIIPAVTDTNGTATVSLLLDQMPGRKLVEVDYPGDSNTLSSYTSAVFDVFIAGDFNLDWALDFTDFAHFASYWGGTCSGPDWCARADLDRNGVVDSVDLMIFLQDWSLRKPPPDFNIDWHVDFHDYAVFANQWSNDCNSPDWCYGCDFDKSGSVDVYDLAEFAESWLSGF